MDLLSQGCGILVGLHLDIEVDGNCVFKSEYENLAFPTESAKLMRHDLVSRVKRIQMGLNSHLNTCVDEKIIHSKVVTGVVPARTSLIPNSERKENAFSKK